METMRKCEFSSIFMSTFNMNGKNLSQDDVEKWLLAEAAQEGERTNNETSITKSNNADLIILSLQECPTYPLPSSSKATTPPLSCHTIPHISSMGPPDSDMTRQDDTLPSMIQQVLNHKQWNKSKSHHHVLIADMAMGEAPATGEEETKSLPTTIPANKKRKISNTNDVNSSEETRKVDKWYGFIRLFVFAKQEFANIITSSSHDDLDSNHHPALIPIFVPTGRKHVSSYISSITTQNHIYNNKNSSSISNNTSASSTVGNSPDKGGICIAIPSLSLLICSLHLCGTNQYHTMESKFDQIRIDELKKIGSVCHEALLLINECYQMNKNRDDIDEDKSTNNGLVASSSSSLLEDYTKIILGDLNFRVEKIAASTTTPGTITATNNNNENEKGRGGHEYQQVHNILQSQSSQKIHDLFWNHDRLVKLMSSLQKSENESNNDDESNDRVVPLLKNMNDVFMMNSNQIFKRHDDKVKNHVSNNTMDVNDINIIYPTFKFQTKSSKEQKLIHSEEEVDKKDVNQSTKQKIQLSSSSSFSLEDILNRKYSDKRTPSWTDRILLDDRIIVNHHKHEHQHPCFEIKHLKANYDICTSDHVPLSCVIRRTL